MAEEEEKRQKREPRTESLGWLTESTVMPKKHRAIEGVGAGSIVELKAQLYKTQEEARKSKDSSTHDPSSRKRPVSTDFFSQKNSGVENRAHKDKLEMKAVKDGSVSYAALEKKAELYEKLSKGQLPDEEENEKYCVDFFQKTLEADPDQSQPSNSRDHDKTENLDNDDRNYDDFARFGVPGLGRTGFAVDRDEHKRFVREVHEEAREERDKASSLKMRRQEQEAARREKLKQAYLKKQLEKLLSAKQIGTTSDSK